MKRSSGCFSSRRLCAWRRSPYDICCAISTWITSSYSLSVRHYEGQSCKTDSCAFLRGYIIQFTSAYFCCGEPFWKDSSTAATKEDLVLENRAKSSRTKWKLCQGGERIEWKRIKVHGDIHCLSFTLTCRTAMILTITPWKNQSQVINHWSSNWL